MSEPAGQATAETLKDRWLGLTERLHIWNEAVAEAIFEELIPHYLAPERHYHNANHILRMLRELDQCGELVEWPEAVEFAIFFHDAIYDTHAIDNEVKSAELAVEKAGRLGLGTGFRNYVSDLINATMHCTAPTDEDERLLVDIDLISLGLPYEQFVEFGDAIRKEYGWVPEQTFNTRRAELFESLLARKSIYVTEHFRLRYEKQARENLTIEVAKLRGGSAA